MKKKTISAKEYYAFLFERKKQEQEQTIDNAVGVIPIGEFTDKQLKFLDKKCQKQSAIGSLWYPVKFIDRQSIPANMETELNFLFGEFDHLHTEYQMALCTISRLANAVKRASGCENENVHSESIPKSATVKQSAQSEPPPIEPQVESDTEDPADEANRLLQEGKGRWVEQGIFLDAMKKARPLRFKKTKTAQRALEGFREKDNVVWSKKETGKVRIGKDKAGNLLEQEGDRNVKQKLSYRYFLLNESNNTTTLPASPSTPSLQ